MKRKAKTPPSEKEKPERRPYRAPGITEEQVFERQALQQCGKNAAQGCALRKLSAS
jgi:hypothetical protein